MTVTFAFTNPTFFIDAAVEINGITAKLTFYRDGFSRPLGILGKAQFLGGGSAIRIYTFGTVPLFIDGCAFLDYGGHIVGVTH